LRIDSEDATGRGRSIRLDGHRRLIEQRNRADGVDTYVTIDYLVGGEPARFVQDRATNLPPSVPALSRGIVRWMQYDSLGRLVLNAEPNTATDFHADPAAAAGTKAWRYAYGWDGQLVGTSDARGCGWNLHYDWLRRLVASDFSPCLKAQAPYSAPDLATGNGTEVFHRYDTPEPGQAADFGSPQYLLGRLVSTRDRAAHTRYAYDGRGRLTGIARRLAPPPVPGDSATDVADLAVRYAGEWFRSEAGSRLGRDIKEIDTPRILPFEPSLTR